ncbi:hypothetical protein MN608_00712 [Microdochium nivale]|nr:hypothetical protein MN608_00712 [Microdochium nivale]
MGAPCTLRRPYLPLPAECAAHDESPPACDRRCSSSSYSRAHDVTSPLLVLIPCTHDDDDNDGDDPLATPLTMPAPIMPFRAFSRLSVRLDLASSPYKDRPPTTMPSLAT